MFRFTASPFAFHHDDLVVVFFEILEVLVQVGDHGHLEQRPGLPDEFRMAQELQGDF